MAKKKTGTTGWGLLYKAGGAAAMAAGLTMIAEIAITALPDGARVIMNVSDLLDMYERNTFMAMRFMGLVNMTAITFMLVFFTAACAAQRENAPAMSLLTFAVFLASTAVFFSCNAAFPLLQISAKYAAAAAPGQKAALIAAAEALFAHGASHTPGTFPGFFLGQAAGILLSVSMIMAKKPFKMSTGIIGIIAFSFLLVFELVSSFAKAYFNQAMVFALIGGVSAIVWNFKSGLELMKAKG